MKETRAVWGRRGSGDDLKTSPVSPQPVTRTHLAAGRAPRVLGRPGERTGGREDRFPWWDGDPMPPCLHGAPSAGDGAARTDRGARPFLPSGKWRCRPAGRTDTSKEQQSHYLSGFFWVKHLQKDLQPEEPVRSMERSLARLHLVPTPSAVTTLSLPELFQN